jgi:hypothetical protein
MMRNGKISDKPALLNVVALLSDKGGENLARGQVGTVVEELDADTVLVEFSNDDGQAFAVVPCRAAELIVLHYEPQTA